MTLSPELLKLLVCPTCRGPVVPEVRDGASRLICATCRVAFPVRDGIPIMLTDEAASLAS